MTATSKLELLRQWMHRHSLAFYWVPGSDPHQSEYVPEHWQRRTKLTGFTGSAGDALVGMDRADLWTDSRYFIQAEAELAGSGFALQKYMPGVGNNLVDWLVEHAAGQRVGIDAQLVPAVKAEQLRAAGVDLVAIDENGVDAVCPPLATLSKTPVTLLSEDLVGKSVAAKLAEVRSVMANQAEYLLVSALDSIAWVLNCRGQDIPYNPLVISYLIIGQDRCDWFVDQNKLSASHQEVLAQAGVIVHDYEDIALYLAQLDGTVWYDPDQTSWWAMQHISQIKTVCKRDPIVLLKACKNPVERKQIRQAHIDDALALISWMVWLDEHWQGQTECSISQKLAEFRYAQPHCQGLSFPTICGFGAHGAIVHYSASPDTDAEITDENMLLIDSGAQYHLGTTDVTRMLHFGQPTAMQKMHYTRVLKGHLALRRAVFPAGTSGAQLDVLARQFLWEVGLDYGHGTGHGVGCYLCVHEGPQGISPRNIEPLLPGMIISNEPGVYLEGQYGIRIENLCEVVTVSPGYYGFQDLTLVPYSQGLIETSLLTAVEVEQINSYHHRIMDDVFSQLPPAERQWLQVQCQPIS